jgi:hypothetical protein
MKKSSVFEWHRWFKEGRENVLNDTGSGQPKSQRTDANVDRVRTLVHSDQRLGTRLIAEELNMNKETLQQIITDDLEMRRISGGPDLDRRPERMSASCLRNQFRTGTIHLINLT